MIQKITKGIRITVETEYREDQSNAEHGRHLFSYFIRIENEGDYSVRLLRRHWYIFDSSGEFREVEGEGVVGQKPLLMPGEVYEYESACDLTTEMGAMHGTYLMERERDGLRFEVHIPRFEMFAPARMN